MTELQLCPALLAAALGWADWLVLLAYLGGIVVLGMWFGKFTATTQEFFFGGQRFSWWLIAVSCVATLVGSYSFLQYSEVAYKFGLSSLVPYTNEWAVLPLFLIAWLPIIYYNRVASVPEYFERRFDRRTRIAVLIIMLAYLQGYIGINLLTIGKVLVSVLDFHELAEHYTGWRLAAAEGGVDWGVIFLATVMAVLSGLYLHAGGQTSVLMTDLFQGLLLLAAGLAVVALGVSAVGGWLPLWETLPPAHRQPFSQFNKPPGFHFVGNFWGDAVTATFAFWLINQGVMMRFLSARSVRDGRRAMLFVTLVLMPLAAVAVGGAGWVGRVMVAQGMLPADVKAEDVFVRVSQVVCHSGLYGLVIAAVVAALMSTLDTLITAVSAVAVNDVWRFIRPGMPDSHYLRVARIAAIGCTLLALLLLPVFQQFTSIYEALSSVINISIPPLIVVIALALVWPRFSAAAAFWTLVVGSAAIVVSLIFPGIIRPVAHGVEPPRDIVGYQQFSYMRGLFGLCVSLCVAVTVMLFDRRPRRTAGDGLTLATLQQARETYTRGACQRPGAGRSVVLPLEEVATDATEVCLPQHALDAIGAKPGDLLYVSDSRRWLGGFRSLHVIAGPACEASVARLPTSGVQYGHLLTTRPVRVMRLE